MGVATHLLVRYGGGYTTIDDAAAVAAWGRKEGFLQLGGVSDRDQAERVALGVLAFLAAPRVTTTLGIEPTGTADEPYVDFLVGDSITAPAEDGSSSEQRVVSLTVSEDDNGEVTFANELNAPFLLAEEAFNRQLKKLLGGALRGQTQAANPLPTGSVTRADTGDSIGAVRDYINQQFLKRSASNIAGTRSGIGTSGGTFDPSTDQELGEDFYVSMTSGTAGYTTVPLSGFPTGLLSAQVQLAEPLPPGAAPYFVSVVESSCSNAQVEILVVDAAGAPYPDATGIELMVHATGW